MEWNKDEALKAKEIAEKKIVEMDMNGALRFAVKAQNMDPTLDGLPQLLATLNIYVSAENKINGEVDWYRVLGVQPSADDETIRKSYRKLALILHPDKNKAIGSDGAFKILSEAWSVLSDKIKRISHDQRRNWGTICKKTPNGSFPMSHEHDRFYHPGPSSQKFSPRVSVGASHLSSVSAHTTTPPYKPTFWTACNACKVQFEFMTRYVNRHLRCPNCHQSFMAVEILPPPINGNGLFSSQASSILQRNPSKMKLSGKADSMGFCYSNLPGKSTPSYGVLPKLGSVRTSPSPALSTAGFQSNFGLEHTQRTHFSMKANGGVRGMSSNASFSSKLDAGGPRKKRRPLEPGANCREREDTGSRIVTAIGGGGSMMETGGGASRPNSTRELSQLETRSLLMQKARTEIQKRLSEWSMMKHVAGKSSFSTKKVKEHQKEMKNSTSNGVQDGASRLRQHMDMKEAYQTEKPSCATSTVDMEVDCSANSMSVPDPDFYDFDKNRVESSFGDNQIWAIYDDDDGMPRYYAFVHNLISAKPFKMRISWLSSKSNLEFSPVKWVASGFPKTCGNLRIGKSEVYDSLYSFSHRVKWTKGPRGIIQIYPIKGDVWALYRNWSADWNEFTSDEIIHSYDMVEVLEDYREDCGVTVAPLVKVPGFRAVFQKHLDPTKVRKIPREEMFRFSHQIPSHKLSGQEATHAPKGCWELDPASTPLELLQVVTECSKEEDLLVGPRMPTGEVRGNGNITAGNISKKDVENNVSEAALKAGGKVQGKKLLVYQRRRRGRKQNVRC
ncbi:uncharacterized protein LOC116214004 isoform X1 [Punica granatum]|uniref:Uncharacterized protein LOC116214004 isoform X1 n=1 Tax=Punica granatum TaxID=22663 RepID=A0A218VY37_PUNGR|nr:uncharacterized protein LOC116214004 isoform X1 [Punica granatum]XP_031405070.1 uncharacterized protein LOC116214004 isoform X1 [Punica granatum]XP_031405071.1 uncharacterized protein LOC116214004 isoform X1 [Punica granatum]OWM65497.1 hypothetical protein CDL15_Pgr009087 [Punica granatum]